MRTMTIKAHQCCAQFMTILICVYSGSNTYLAFRSQFQRNSIAYRGLELVHKTALREKLVLVLISIV